ncbi:two-component regulator propeller domain-containing protein [Mucilaginibacter sp. PAMB04168]|uniref:hybrid sensor histidine kinase/response regulator transcription factor n=1 Tax=Mucilaginibacter sp. PAMB04168 TaxID=3138567 RepID=UPI0031F6E5B8
MFLNAYIKNAGIMGLLLMLCVMLTSKSVVAQLPEIKFDYLTREQGLSNSTVTSIFQDSKGYIWLGTEDGLNLYDGYRITSFKSNGTSEHTLSNSNITQIFEDSKQRLWVATEHGLNQYYRNSNSFIRYTRHTTKGHLTSNIINCISEDKLGYLWLGTAAGLQRFDWKNGTFRYYVLPRTSGKSSPTVTCIYPDTFGRLLIGTDGNGVLSFDIKSKKFLKPTGRLNEVATLRIKTIEVDKQNKLWIGTTGNGVFVYDRQTNQIHNYINQQYNTASLSNNVVKSILCDSKGQVWIATENGGVNLWNAASKTFSRYENNANKPYSLSQKTASALFEDRQGNIWIGTHRGGANIYRSNTYKFKTYTQGSASGMLSYKDVKTFFEDKSGTIWVGTDGGGINLWNPLTDQFKQYRYNAKQENTIGSDAILHIMQDRQGHIWVGTWGGGLNLYNPANGTFKRYVHRDGDPNSISSNNVWRIFEDKQGNLWVATFYGGLNIFNPKTEKFSRITKSFNGQTEFVGNNVVSINQDYQNNLWFGTDDGGLNCLNFQTRQFTHYFYNVKEGQTGSIRTIYTDTKHRLWVGSNGLYLFNPAKKQFGLASTHQYLINEKIQAIIEDKNASLWVSTSNGLISFNSANGYVKRYTDADGLQGLEFCQNACLKTRNGQLLFGGFKGFNVFNPDSIASNHYRYPIYITDLQIFNKSIKAGTSDKIIDKSITEAEKVTLDYNQSVLSFEYAALNYVAPAKTQYAYFLKGFDKGWNKVGTQRKATYTNLDPGRYTFYVKASTPDGKWNTQPASVDVIIRPPFWLTWWFKLLAGLSITGSIFLYLYYRRKSELRVIHEQKREEMHQLQLQFFTNISHEFRTPLTLILGPLEQILKQDTGSAFTRQFHTIHRNANRLMQLISELMDFRKAESGALKLKVMESNFSVFIDEIALEFEDLARQHQIQFTVKKHANFNNAYFDRQVVEKILLNLLNNSFKYTPEQGHISIEVLASLEGFTTPYSNTFKIDNDYKAKKYLYISISDSGIGISKDSISYLFERYYRITDSHLGSGVGLAFVKTLTLLHKGYLLVNSERHQGTNIIVALPCHPADYSRSEMWIEHPAEGGVQLESMKYKELLYKPKIASDTLELSTDQTLQSSPLVLIVDDNAELRAYIKELLQPFYQIIEARNGQEGLDKAKEQSPALIMSDLMMPVMDGIEFCATVKADFETSHIPFIMLTAKDAIESRLQGVESGADYYFSKPINTSLLLITIKNLFEQRQKIKERYYKDYQVEVRELVHSSKDKAFMNDLLSLLEEKLEDPDLNVDWVCQEIGISKTKLYKKIKDITGQTINEFIRSLRLKKATEIMTHEDVLITEVMYRVGILSQSYFTTIFKKEFGVTPSQFQQQLEGKGSNKVS